MANPDDDEITPGLRDIADALKGAIDGWAACLARAIDHPTIRRELYEHAQSHEMVLAQIVNQTIVGTSAQLYIARVDDVARKN